MQSVHMSVCYFVCQFVRDGHLSDTLKSATIVLSTNIHCSPATKEVTRELSKACQRRCIDLSCFIGETTFIKLDGSQTEMKIFFSVFRTLAVDTPTVVSVYISRSVFELDSGHFIQDAVPY